MERRLVGQETSRAASEIPFSDSSMIFLPWRDQNPEGLDDDGDATQSRYSSCGESEFERYCSANSVMGTPSACSTLTLYNDWNESDFGSMKNLGLEDDNSGLENFSLGGRVEKSREEVRVLGDRIIEFNEGSEISDKSRLNYGCSGFQLYGNDDEFNLSGDGNLGALDVNEMDSWKAGNKFSPVEDILKINNDLDGGDSGEDEGGSPTPCRGGDGIDVGKDSEENKFILESNTSHAVGGGVQFIEKGEECPSGYIVGRKDGDCYAGLKTEFSLQCDVKGIEREEDENSPRNEHSEGEDSMYNYGMDDEAKVDFNCDKNIHYYQEAKAKNENPFLMSSSVAFGSEDWNDFLQESEGRAFGSASLTTSSLWKQKEHKAEIDSNLVTSDELPPACQTGQGKRFFDMPIARVQVQDANKTEEIVECSSSKAGFLKADELEELEDVRDIPVASSCQAQTAVVSIDFSRNSDTVPSKFPVVNVQELEAKRAISFTNHQIRGAHELTDCTSNCSLRTVFKIEQDPLAENAPENKVLDCLSDVMPKIYQHIDTDEAIKVDNSQVVGHKGEDKSKVNSSTLANVSTHQPELDSTLSLRKIDVTLLEDFEPKTKPSTFVNTMIQNTAAPVNHIGKHPAPVKVDDLLKTDNFELNEFYDEVVHEMEEILLDASESPGARFPQGNRMLQSKHSLPLRDGGSSASTSGAEDYFFFLSNPLRIDWVEVVGARQKKGDVSFSERLVGVKEYTVYKIRVWSGKDQWEVERRYRDFFTLYRRLKTSFADQGWVLPSPWASVEKESRKIFGNASPDVIAERSILMQECLRSILLPKLFSASLSVLIWFLSPQKSIPSSPSSVPQPVMGGHAGNGSALGKTISLIVEIHPYKSTKQMLEAQHYTCAGCHKHFDDGKTLIRDFAQTFGWGKPRLCEYTGQLFCSSCHMNETAVLPARVLHDWDFTLYPVSQLAKSYLDSIHDKPMLCVSAVNPFLFSKVPALVHVTGFRKKIGNILTYVHCSYLRSISKGLGSRRYLLESNDFFALRDLIDLSKGAFAVLPAMVETVLKKILEHITDQCLICCDVGIPCSGRQACKDPSSLIFPFQEDDVERCPSCESVFHKHCFRKLTNCKCGAYLRIDEAMRLTKRLNHRAGGEANGGFGHLRRASSSALGIGFLSGLFTQSKEEMQTELKNSDNVILMGSLPSTVL